MNKVKFLFLLILTASCSGRLFQSDNNYQARSTLDEVRLELADLKHSLKSTQVSLHILEERCRSYDNAFALLDIKDPHVDQLGSHLALLESKFAQMEKFQDKVLSDLRNLNAHSRQQVEQMKEFEQEIHLQKTRLSEVTQLKTTLNSIAQSMENRSSPSGHKHKVLVGDTLDRIARRYSVSVGAIQKKNHLSSDRIHIGQELLIPYE